MQKGGTSIKKSNKSKLFIAFNMCLVATIALTSASYAWFTYVINPDVEEIQLYVNASDAMMLSALPSPGIYNANDWMVSLLKSEITDTNRGNQTDAFPIETSNVSSLFNNVSSDFYSATFSSQGDITDYSVVAQKNNFVKFTLWVKSTNGGFVYLYNESFVKSLSLIEPNNSVESTVRIGVVPVNYDTNGADSGGEIVGEAWDYAVIWEPNSKKHLGTAYGGTGGTNKLTTSAVFGTGLGNTSPQTTFDFNDTNVNGTDYFNGKATPTLALVPDTAKKIALFNMNMDTMQKVNFYIWVEGADSDTLNVVAKNWFRTYLKFGQEHAVFKGNTFKTT